MTSFITTMFVRSSPSPHPSTPTSPSQLMNSFPSPPKPLDSVVTSTQALSSSCIRLPTDAVSPQQQTPRSAHAQQGRQSPAQAALLRAPPPVYNNYRFLHKGAMSDPNYVTSNSRTRTPFRPQKAGKGTTNWQLKQFAEATLGSGSLRKAVKLPEGEDKDEWLAVNCVDFYNQINLLYGSITEFCSPQTCPEMKATDEYEYLWQDETPEYRKPTKMPAPTYVEHLMTWVQSAIDDESIFPSRIGVPFPKTFRPRVTQIFKRLYRVYAHIYCHHYPIVVALGLEPHLNTSFKHYVLFVEEFGLNGGQKDYWGPMGELVENMVRSD